MPIKSLFADVDIPVVDLWTYYMEQPRVYPESHPLFVDGNTGRAHTFADIKKLALQFGQGIAHQWNWKRGDVMGFYAPNSIDVPCVNLGIQWAGGIASPANPTYTVSELARQLKDSGARALITQKAFLGPAREAAQAAGISLDKVILLGDERDETGAHRHWTEITAAGAKGRIQRPVIDPKTAITYIVYSSGTTGLPKGVPLTHYNIMAMFAQFGTFDLRMLNWNIDSQLGILPFFHVYGLAPVTHATLQTGATMVVMSKFNLEHACQLIQKYRVTFIYCPPPIVLGLGKDPVVEKYDLSSLRWINCAAAPLSNELVVAVWERLKIGVKQAYGLSETTSASHVQFIDEWWKLQGSVGKLFPNMLAKIVDEEGNEVPQGEAGELLLKGPNVFSSYWNRPDLQAETFTDDGWFKTGDVLYMDVNHNFFITDRKKELIKYKGFQVPPAELEAKIHGHPAVADCCVVGVWDKNQHTEVPRAYIVLKDSHGPPSAALGAEIADWLAQQVAPPKKLRGGVRFIDEIPKSASGKILRRLLRDQAKAEDAAAEEPVKARL